MFMIRQAQSAAGECIAGPYRPVGPIQGFSSCETHPPLLRIANMSSIKAGRYGLHAAAHRDVPQVGPALLKGLPLLDQHFPLRVEDTDVDNQVVLPRRQRRAPLHRLAGFPPVCILYVPKLHFAFPSYRASRRRTVCFTASRSLLHSTGKKFASSSGGRSHQRSACNSPVSSSSNRALINRAGLPPTTV